jgi:uncharacterized flavoprotein (TIGR03862 family)
MGKDQLTIQQTGSLKKKVTIIGGGACALMLACELNPNIFDVSICEKNATLGRKFLVAGDGGFNLTHSEDPEIFISRYTPSGFLQNAFNTFNNLDFVKWLDARGIETFVGSSGRIFPIKGIKPIVVLNRMLELIKRNNVLIHTKQNWKGLNDQNELVFEHNGTLRIFKSDFTVFCLGGATWPVTGSDGEWRKYFVAKKILVNNFAPSNCAFKINWRQTINQNIIGKALKNCSISCGGVTNFGEVVFTAEGIEGSGIYPLSPMIRQELKQKGTAIILIDFKPIVSFDTILRRLSLPNKKSPYTKHIAEQIHLNQLQITLLKNFVDRTDFLNVNKLAQHIKGLRIELIGAAPIADAISSVGGIDLSEITDQFELKKMPQHFVIGEMLDFDAPTGGYLLQSCFTMGKRVADYLNNLK